MRGDILNRLITEANELLKGHPFEYAICGGFAIELFLNKEIRKHGDIDISAFWADRDQIILYMQSLGWQVYEMCGGGLAHHITDISKQVRAKRNIFCFTNNCDLVTLSPTETSNMYTLEFNHSGQKDLNFIEFLFNHKTENDFLYARNNEISLSLSRAILYQEGVPYLAPELVLLYKSTDIHREGYQLDYDSVFGKMNNAQRLWLQNALSVMNPDGHSWL